MITVMNRLIVLNSENLLAGSLMLASTKNKSVSKELVTKARVQHIYYLAQLRLLEHVPALSVSSKAFFYYSCLSFSCRLFCVFLGCLSKPILYLFHIFFLNALSMFVLTWHRYIFIFIHTKRLFNV